MYGDTEVMRRRAGQLRDQGAGVRALAEQLVAQTDALGWAGRAADSMRQRVQERATDLRSAAGQHETAAEALDRHLHEVESIQDAIAATERKAAALIADDRAPAEFTPPPSGHKDWLTVDLPGL